MIFVGHTHIPFLRTLNGQMVVNPGSLGQPKTGKPDACYAVWEDGQVSLRTYGYPVNETVRKIRSMPIARKIQEDLIAVLESGAFPRNERKKTRMAKIVSLDALEILDSRGNPTIQVAMALDSGAIGVAKVPSGASTGKKEAVELRDGDKKRYQGKGVRKAIENVLRVIQPAVIGMDASEQQVLDEKLIALDGTPNKARLGGERDSGSLARGCQGLGLRTDGAAVPVRPAERESYLLPVPMFNVLNGGRHADNNVDFQEFMIAPVGAPTFSEALQSGSETFHALKDILHKKGYETSVGDEGGFAPRLRSNEEHGCR